MHTALSDDPDLAAIRSRLRIDYLSGRQARLAGDLPTAMARLRAASAACAAARADRGFAAQLLTEIGLTFKYWGTPGRSIPLYRRAMTLLGGVDSPHPLVPDLEHNLGGALHACGDLVAAERHARRAVRLRTLRRDRDGLLSDRIALAGVLTSLNRLDESVGLLTSALDHLERTDRRTSGDAASALHNLAAVAHQRGDARQAIVWQSESVRIRVAEHGEVSPYTVVSFANLGRMHLAAGHRLAARAAFERAGEILRVKVSPRHPVADRVRDGLSALSAAPRSVDGVRGGPEAV